MLSMPIDVVLTVLASVDRHGIVHVTCRVGQGWDMRWLSSVFDQTLGFEGEGPSVAHTIQVGQRTSLPGAR